MNTYLALRVLAPMADTVDARRNLGALARLLVRVSVLVRTLATIRPSLFGDLVDALLLASGGIADALR